MQARRTVRPSGQAGLPDAAVAGVGAAGVAAPAALPAEAASAVAGELRDRVGNVLALGPPVEWTFTWTRAVAHDTVTRLVSELSPAAVVVGAPRRPRLSAHRSVVRWLIGRPNVRAVVVPA
jgi:hypothetical protein